MTALDPDRIKAGWHCQVDYAVCVKLILPCIEFVDLFNATDNVEIVNLDIYLFSIEHNLKNTQGKINLTHEVHNERIPKTCLAAGQPDTQHDRRVRHRSAISEPSLFRRQRSATGQVRDAAACANRRLDGQPRSVTLWLFSTVVLHHTSGVCTPRLSWAATREVRAKIRPQTDRRRDRTTVHVATAGTGIVVAYPGTTAINTVAAIDSSAQYRAGVAAAVKKKQPSPTLALLDNGVMDQYECLRDAALNHASVHRLGGALLLSRGLWAWAQAWQTL